MKANNLITIIIFILCIPLTLLSQNILGPENLCVYKCEIYSVAPNSEALYVWSVQGGKLNVNTGNEVKICWNEIGTHTISVVDINNVSTTPILTLEVSVLSDPQPDIYFPEFPICNSLDSLPSGNNDEFPELSCQTACKNTTASYSAIGSENSNFSWTIEGGDIVDSNENSISINWGDSDFGNIFLSESNIADCSDSIFYCIELLDNPDITIQSSTNGSNPCVGQTVYLEAEGTNAVSYMWYLNGAFISNQINTSFDIPNNQIQNIKLVSTSECKCTDTTYYQITPTSDLGPEIDCTGTVCVGEATTYYAFDICGEYTWSISSNGTITEGGGIGDNFISVIWNSGENGEVNLSVDNCNEPRCTNSMSSQIPIVNPLTTINGPISPCNANRAEYTVTSWPGTIYNWQLSGNGNIVEGQGTHRIIIEWQEESWIDQTAQLSVDYENCILECTGSANLNINLEPEFKISAWRESVCEGEAFNVDCISGFDGINCDWEVFDQDGNLIQVETNERFIEIIAPEGIAYLEINAFNPVGDFCNTSAKGFVTIDPRPDTPSEYNGPQIVCPNTTMFYTSDLALSNNYQLIWVFNDGSNSTEIIGNQVSYVWTSNGPFSIDLAIKDVATDCSSEFNTFALANQTLATLSAPEQACPDKTIDLNLEGVDPNDVEWSITPTGSGQVYINEENIAQCMFYNSGDYTINGIFCGQSISHNIEIINIQEAIVNAPEGICVGENTSVTLTPIGNTTTQVFDADGNFISDDVTFSVPAGIYTVETISPLGCSKKSIFVIDQYDLPDIRISTPESKGYCDETEDRTLYALDAIDGYTYNWFKDGSPIGLTSEIITIVGFGEYQIEITNSNGCVNFSNVIKLYEECDISGYCDDRCDNFILCPSDEEVTFSTTNLGFCNAYSFQNTSTSGVDITTLAYDFDDPQSGINNITREENADHIFSHAGFYQVMLSGKVPALSNPLLLCDDYITELITVPVASNFEYQPGCNGSEIEFLDKSTFLDGFSIVAYEWDFGDALSSDNTSADRNPTHIYSESGSYWASLTITSSDGCKARFIKEIIIFDSPDFDIPLPLEQCVNESILFEAIDTGNFISYLWEFDNPDGSPSTIMIESPEAILLYDIPGMYSASLSVENSLGCVSSKNITFEVGTNSMTGDIIADQTFPVCQGDSVTLTAPTGGIHYIWSNGNITQSIKAADPGIYTVTVIGNSACHYKPEELEFTVIPRPEIYIQGYTYSEDYTGEEEHFASLEVCETNPFALRTQFIPSATYLWSTGDNFSYLSYNSLSSLGVGIHEITVDVTTGGCTFTSDPFIINIHANPPAVTVVSSNDLCEGEDVLLEIQNPNPDLNYFWNNGQTGTQITTSTAGSYFATAVNNNGCSTESNYIWIDALPNTETFQTGCVETCFPDEICFSSNSPIGNIRWLLNGSLIIGESNTTLNVTEAGDYQIVLESFSGCIDTSNVLSLIAKSNDHSVFGLVYIDTNNNGVFDTGDSPLNNVPVSLMQGATILSNTNSDTNGNYTIDPVPQINTFVRIDTTGLNINNDIQLDYPLEFSFCEEDLELNIPISKDCIPIAKDLTLVTCPNETVEFNGQMYSNGDTDIVTVQFATACDTTYNITVIEKPTPNITFNIIESCALEDNGQLEIMNLNTGEFNVSINNNAFGPETIFDNLSFGNHEVILRDLDGCTFDFNLFIDEIPLPNVSTATLNTCSGMNNGSLTIASSDPDLTYSIDGINFSANSNFENLGQGNYTLYTQFGMGCITESTFDILEEPEINIDFLTQNTCANTSEGIIEIINIPMNTLIGINGNTPSAQDIFTNLPEGTYTIEAYSITGCTNSYDVTVESFDVPDLNLSVIDACDSKGSIEIDVIDGKSYNYSLDNTTFTSDQVFDELNTGVYTLFVEDIQGCIFEESFTINETLEPLLQFNTTGKCSGENNGALSVTSMEPGLEYALDGNSFDINNKFENLSSGLHKLEVKKNDCLFEFDIMVDDITPLDVSFEDPIFDCSVTSITLTPNIIAGDDINFKWNTGSQEESITVSNSGVFEVEVFNECSTITYQYEIEFDNAKEQDVFIPNVFSPNHDGKDDGFKAFTSSEINVQNFIIKVFDQWGNPVFTSDDINREWDGYGNGKKSQTGVYVWSYEMTFDYCSQTAVKKDMGTITLVR